MQRSGFQLLIRQTSWHIFGYSVLVKDCFGGGVLVGVLRSWTESLEMCLFLLNSKTGGKRFNV